MEHKHHCWSEKGAAKTALPQDTEGKKTHLCQFAEDILSLLNGENTKLFYPCVVWKIFEADRAALQRVVNTAQNKILESPQNTPTGHAITERPTESVTFTLSTSLHCYTGATGKCCTTRLRNSFYPSAVQELKSRHSIPVPPPPAS